MAKVFPIYKPELDNAPSVSSEKKAYAALAQNLSNDYTVLFNTHWSGKEAATKSQGGHQDFECDFIVLHPQEGILVVEVKGGGIQYDGHYNQWHSINRHGESFKIKDPIEQALKNKHALRRYLADKFSELYDHRLSLKMSHAVWFVDVDYNIGDFPRAPEEIVLSRESLNDPTPAIQKAMAYFKDEHQSQNRRPLNTKDFERVIGLLLPSGEFKRSLVKTLESGEVEILNLTQEQTKLLRSMKNQNRIVITGGAGTGKTVLGMEKAKDEAKKGKRVLYTCYNKQMTMQLAKQYESENLKIINFHRLCHDYAKLTDQGHLFEQKENTTSQDFWEQTTPEILEEAVITLGEDMQFDAIIIDEVQDFAPQWLRCLTQTLIKDINEGQIYLLGDSDQSIYRDEDFNELTKNFFTFELFENLRNTQEIFQSYNHFTQNDCEACGPHGEEVQYIDCDPNNLESLEKAIDKKVGQLLSQRLKPSDITVLSGKHPKKCFDKLLSNKRFTTNPEEKNKNKTLITTIHAYKGLENKVIILTHLDKIRESQKKELLYVGCSRAKGVLVVVGSVEVVRGGVRGRHDLAPKF